MTEPGVEGQVMDHWDAVVEDMEATAEEYREAGWEVVTVHPGNVTMLPGQEADRFGLDVLAPDDEVDAVADLAAGEDASFDSASVYRATASDVVFLVVAMEDPGREVAVVVAAYYDARDRQTLDTFDRAREAGEMRTHVRNLQGDPLLTFFHDDPELFAPPDAPE